jgi:hypothetical protein
VVSSIQLKPCQALADVVSNTGGKLTLIVNADLLFRETCKVDDIVTVGVDIEKVDARPEMLHQ